MGRLTFHLRSYPTKSYGMSHSVDFFVSYKILFFSFKNANVKMKVDVLLN